MQIKSFGHFLATIAQGIVTAAKATKNVLVKAGAAAPAIAAAVASSEPIVEGVSAAIDPRAVAIERAAYYIFGEVAAAIARTGDAASANGVSINLDAAAIQQIKDAQNHIASVVKGDPVPAV